MEKKYEIKLESLILVELYRFLDIVREKNPNGFDLFENDIFMIYDPLLDNKECTCGVLDNIESEESNNENELSESKDNEILDELKDDVIYSEDEDDEDIINRNVTIAVADSIYSSFQFNDFCNSIGLGLKSAVHDDDCLLEIPNFHYKPTNLKLWYDDSEKKLFSNKNIRFREFSSILLNCVSSLGRRTSEFVNREFIWVDGYLDINRELSEADENALEWLYEVED